MSNTTYGFELLFEEHIPELDTQAQFYRHVKTGAELLSLINGDENKVFGITFRTPPTDSTGLPHIMEHSVLCGSRKYPSKEPFVQLLKGSLQTFLNAMTYPDKTVYPVASQNRQDFYNLVDVYLDAVFYPRISPQVLQQEGWHYELEQLGDPLIFKGVVFNEMKGSYSSPERRLSKAMQESIFPDNTYGVDSGGDPVFIPDLSYPQFKQFHDTYYHPSNSRIFFYGDDDPCERLRLLAEYLDNFEHMEVNSAVDRQPRFTQPKLFTHFYPVSEQDTSDKNTRVAVSWMLDEHREPQFAMSLRMLNYLLLGTSGSPLRKALIDSGLGEDLVGYGLDADYRQMMFSTGLKGVASTDANKVEPLILETLTRLADEGFEQDAIEAAINSTEFSLRENNSGTYPRGLLCMLRSLSTWLYDGDPLAYLKFEAPLQALKARIQRGEPVFQDMIRQYFLNNSHRTTIILRPDPMMAQKLEEAERARLDKIQASMSDEQLLAIIENTNALKQAQETPDPPEVVATIPSLKLADLDKQNKLIPLEECKLGDTTVLYHDLFTNGIAYLDIALDLHLLPEELIPYGPLFGKVLLQMGTETEDYVKLSQRIDRYTGGFSLATHIDLLNGNRTRSATAWLFLRGKAMVSQVDKLIDILHDIFHTVRLDNQERFLQLVLESKARLEASLIPRGHRFVNRRVKSELTEADWGIEQINGISQLFFLRKLIEQVKNNWPRVLYKLGQIRELMFKRNAMVCNVTTDAASWQAMQPKLGSFLNSFPYADAEPALWLIEIQAPPSFEGLTIPARVNYVGKAANLERVGHKARGSDLVVSRYLRTSWMWEKIRVQGGAYGALSSFDPSTGIFSFLSYRDPNLLETLDVYDRASSFLREFDFTEEEITTGIVGTIGSLDTYRLPDAKGLTSLKRYLSRFSDEELQQRREEILNTTIDDFRAFADTLDLVKEHGSIVVMGAQNNLEAANEQLSEDKQLSITKVL